MPITLTALSYRADANFSRAEFEAHKRTIPSPCACMRARVQTLPLPRPRVSCVYATSTSRQMRKGSYIVATEVFNTRRLSIAPIPLCPLAPPPSRHSSRRPAPAEIPTRFTLLMQSHYPRKKRGDSFVAEGEGGGRREEGWKEGGGGAQRFSSSLRSSRNNAGYLFFSLFIRGNSFRCPRSFSLAARPLSFSLIGMRSFIPP